MPLAGPSLEDPVAVYDPLRQRVIAFGGSSYPGNLNEIRIWVLALQGRSGWTELVTTGPSPLPREAHTAIYDPVRDRVLVFGGWGGWNGRGILNDVWALTLSGTPAWSLVTVEGNVPRPRAGHTAIYDPVDDAMIIFGGGDIYPADPYNDTWSLSLSGIPEWHQLSFSGLLPAGRLGHGAVYDPVQRRMIVCSGGDRSGLLGDTWALSLGNAPAWSRLSGAPARGLGQVCVYDPVGERMVFFGGYTDRPLADTWALSLAGPPVWTELTAAGAPPPPRTDHAAVYDPAGRRMIVLGGIGKGGKWGWGDDTWALSLAGAPVWTPVIGGGGLPLPRYDQSAVYDSARERMVIYGGYSGGDFAQFVGDVWALPLGGSTGWEALWTQASRTFPGRAGHSAIYDPVRDRMLVFGGAVDGGEEGSLPANDLWAFTFSSPNATWSLITAAGAGPSPRAWQRAIYDPGGDRMLVYGGYDGTVRGDLWSLSLAGVPTWSELHPEGAGPGPLSAHSMVYDAKEKRMLLFGGSDGHACRGETWALSLGEHPAWSLLMPATDPRLARSFHSASYDERERRLVIWGGSECAAGGDVNDGWALSLKGKPEWRELSSANAPPDPREGHTAICDPEGERMVIFAGNATLNDTWALPLSRSGRRSVEDEDAVSAAAAIPAGFELSAPRPNPFDGESVVEFTLPEAGPVSLHIYDAGGRTVRRLAEGVYAPGAHRVRWDGRDDAGRGAATGFYFVRLMSPGGVRVRKLVLARGMVAR